MEKIKAILLATYTHATNLARFTFIYKIVRYLFKYLLGEVKQHHTMIAGKFYNFNACIFCIQAFIYCNLSIFGWIFCVWE